MKVSGFTVVLLSLVLAACAGRNTPDEFQVIERQRLVVPPENTLRPPRPGKPQARPIDPGQVAYEALFPGKTFPGRDALSKGERLLLSNLGYSEPGIRTNVASKDLPVVPKRLVLNELLQMEDREFAPDNITIERRGSSR